MAPTSLSAILPAPQRLDAATIKHAAQDRWLAILAALAPALHPALAHPGRHVPCPVHGGRDGFRLYRDAASTGGGICNTCGAHPDGFALLGWVNGWRFAETVQAVAEVLGLNSATRPPLARPTPSRPTGPTLADVKRRQAALGALYDAAQPLTGADPGSHYLAARGLRLPDPPAALACHQKVPYWHGDAHGRPVCLGQFPALLAAVRHPHGHLLAVHRTYLAGGNKLALRDPDRPDQTLPARKLTPALYPGALKGAAVRLFPAGPVLAVAEGIETALAFHLFSGHPVWAAISAQGMEDVILPREVRHVIIAADRDPNGRGEAAAQVLRRRLLREGRRVAIALPPGATGDQLDFNDILQGGTRGRVA